MGREETRAMIPEFTEAKQLHQFVERLFIYKLTVPGTFAQVNLCACIICMLLAIISLISVRRLVLRNFWLFRLVHRSTGVLVVPNSVLTFTVVEGIFAILFVAFQWLVCKWYQYKNTPPSRFCLWYLLLWIPLIFAPIWAAEGTYFALPRSVELLEATGRPRLLRPICVNILSLAIPASLAVSISIPAIVADHFYSIAYQNKLAYIRTHGNATQLRQDMVQDAQKIWYEILKAAKVLHVAFVLWTFWALCMGCTYSYVSWSLITTIQEQLRASQRTSDSNRCQRDNWKFSDRQRNVQSRIPEALAENFTANGRAPKHTGSLQTSLHLGKTTIVRHQNTEVVEANHFFSEEEMMNDTLSASFFPPVRPSRFFQTDHKEKKAAGKDQNIGAMTCTREEEGDRVLQVQEQQPQQAQRRLQLRSHDLCRHHLHGEPHEQFTDQAHMQRATSSLPSGKPYSVKVKELRGAYIHLWIQFAAISPACFLFAGAACSLAAGCYGLYEQPSGTDLNDMGVKFEILFNCELIAKNWIVCIFGTITLTAIIVKTYEHAFASLTAKVPVIGRMSSRSRDTFSPTTSSFFETRTRYNFSITTTKRQIADPEEDFELARMRSVTPPRRENAFNSILGAPSARSFTLNRPVTSAPTIVRQPKFRLQGGVWYQIWGS